VQETPSICIDAFSSINKKDWYYLYPLPVVYLTMGKHISTGAKLPGEVHRGRVLYKLTVRSNLDAIFTFVVCVGQ